VKERSGRAPRRKRAAARLLALKTPEGDKEKREGSHCPDDRIEKGEAAQPIGSAWGGKVEAREKKEKKGSRIPTSPGEKSKLCRSAGGGGGGGNRNRKRTGGPRYPL